MSAADLFVAPPGEGWELDNEGAFMALIGPVWRRQVSGQWHHGLVAAPQHLNRDGGLHGGMFLALFDHALGDTACTAGGGAKFVTIQLGAQFAGGAVAGDFLELRSEIVKKTASYMFMHGRCYCRNELLATADGIWKKLRPR